MPLTGYFTWSLMDNFEWSYGFTKKFGLFAVDPGNLRRIPRDSANWYRDVVAANSVDDALTPISQGDSRALDP